ncbi:HAD-IC family P-type ATPase [Legionella sp. 27cVA30]|nr:HAD-IC family P-type ATPase [Legionella sp. 27cVA30]MCP0913384.1 HAD-IC family P-type ATPase [Legionella sp. 27cVA30]
MMLESAPLILGFWHLGEAIEHTLLDKINEELDVRDCAPETVLLKGNPDRQVSVKQLIPNDMIVIEKGQVIPVDGVLTQPALLYTTRINGSPYLKQFSPGEAVKAGMCLASHIPTLEMRVTQTHQNSYLSLIAKNINKANDEKAPIELVASKILKYFVPGLLAIAIIAGVVTSLLFPPALAVQCVISILVSACPCALSLITPMAVRIGMKKASEKGVHYKNGKMLQAAADIDIVVFDLNGTLTEGEISINRLSIQDEKLLKFFALLEGESDHPVAKTIKSYIEQQGITIDESLEVTHVDKSHHSGIKGDISGETFMVGNKEMLFANGINHINAPYDDVKNGTIYMVRGSTVIGQIALTDPLRKDAIATVKQLKSMGKQIHICTGADKATAEQYAALLGISNDNICANTVGVTTTGETSEISKESYIRGLQRRGHKVAMVGDAANDLTAIAHADIGVAVKSNIGDTVTEQHAGIVIQQGLLFPLATAFDVSAKTNRNIFQNLFVSFTYNTAITLVTSILFIALGFALHPAVGVTLMILESAIVLANLYRLKQQETVSPVSNTAENELNGEHVEQTTAKVLNSLGFQTRNSLGVSQESMVEDLSEHPVVFTSAGRQLGFFSAVNSSEHGTARDRVLSDNVPVFI